MAEIIHKQVDFNEITELDSLCMKCHAQGKTKILLTKIPFFKEVVIMSFYCDACGCANNEIQNAGVLADNGIKHTLKITKDEDYDRLLVASNNAFVYIPELELEIPKVSKGTVTTVQGLFAIFREDLEMNLERLKEVDPEGGSKVEIFIEKLKSYENRDNAVSPFHLILDDPSGNSYISNPFAPLPDSNLKVEKYKRTKEQLYEMGYISDNEYYADAELQEKHHLLKEDYTAHDKLVEKKVIHTDKDMSEMMVKMQGYKKKTDGHKLDYSMTIQEQELDEKLAIFIIPCHNCMGDGEMRSVTCEIPFFKELLIMSFTCEHCGFRSNEVKVGGEISAKGKIITLRVEEAEDLNRDLFKSDTATISIPELEFDMQSGSLGSFYTTVEGLLDKILDGLKNQNPFVGDSSEPAKLVGFYQFLSKFEQAKKGEFLPFTLILNDVMDNCFILNPYYPKEDPRVDVVEFERTEEQNEDLGISHFGKEAEEIKQ